MEEVEYTKHIRWIGGNENHKTLGVNIPHWVFDNFDFEEGEEVKITIEKTDSEEKEED